MTAVEWIISKLPMVNDNDPYLAGLINQAKEMEKKQIMDAYDQGEFDCGMNGTANEYYDKL